ncbi:MAG: hypothetical protein AVDCRST_MAG45-1758, partial [uncultured Solirubrobacterales bacterium]
VRLPLRSCCEPATFTFHDRSDERRRAAGRRSAHDGVGARRCSPGGRTACGRAPRGRPRHPRAHRRGGRVVAGHALPTRGDPRGGPERPGRRNLRRPSPSSVAGPDRSGHGCRASAPRPRGALRRRRGEPRSAPGPRRASRRRPRRAACGRRVRRPPGLRRAARAASARRRRRRLAARDRPARDRDGAPQPDDVDLRAPARRLALERPARAPGHPRAGRARRGRDRGGRSRWARHRRPSV